MVNHFGVREVRGIQERGQRCFAEAILTGMRTLFIVQLSNATPILPTSVKFAIRGIHGTAGQCWCMPLSSNGGGR